MSGHSELRADFGRDRPARESDPP